MSDAQPHDLQAPHDHPFELLDPDGYNQYLLRAQTEVLFVLRALAHDAARITAYFNEGRDFLLTTIVAIEDDSLVLDYGSNADINRRALASPKLFCVTAQDRVRIQFILRGIRQIDFEGRPAFRSEIPDSVMRLQRREYFRLVLGVLHPLPCRIPVPRPDGSSWPVEVNVVDISGGGISIAIPPEDAPFQPGAEFSGCRIDLPEVGMITTQLRIRNRYEVTLKNGSRVQRAGCQFVNLPGPMLTLIQRYIIKVERERKARETGLS